MSNEYESNSLIDDSERLQSTMEIDVESQEKKTKKREAEETWWDRLTNNTEEAEREAERLAKLASEDDPNLTPQEYLKIQSNLINSRKTMKSQNARIKSKHDEAQDNLLKTYEKFHKYVASRDREPWIDKSKVSNKVGADAILDRITTDDQPIEIDAELKQRSVAHLEELQKDILKSSKTLSTYTEQLEAQMKNTRVFLNDQGRVLAVVEKATARKENDSQGQDLKRSMMYKTIVKAVYDSPALDALDPKEAEKERNDILEILRQLELVENQTDELIQRVFLKLKAISQEEKSQISQIQDQLNAQGEMNSDLDELTAQIMENNESIKGSTTELKDRILKNLSAIQTNAKVQLVAYCLLAIVILCAAIAVYFLYNQVV